MTGPLPWCPMRGFERGDRCIGSPCAWCVGRDEEDRPVCAIKRLAEGRRDICERRTESRAPSS